jgi:hypothetical protein
LATIARGKLERERERERAEGGRPLGALGFKLTILVGMTKRDIYEIAYQFA